jgi:hypothetical protein
MRKLIPLAFLLLASLGAHAAERLLTPPAFDALLAYYPQPPAIATDGSSFLAAWIAQTDSGMSMMAQRLDAAAGGALPSRIIDDPKLADSVVDMTWSGTSYLAIWNRGIELHALRLDRGGRPLGDRVVAGDLRNAVVASNGPATLVVAHDVDGDQTVVLTLDATDAVVQRRAIARNITPCGVVARDGGFTVALVDGGAILAMRFDAAGAPIDSSPRRAATVTRPYGLALASRGAETLIVSSALDEFRQPPAPYLFATILPASGDASPIVALPGDGFVTGLDAAGDAAGYTLLVTGAPLESPGPENTLRVLHLGADAAAPSPPRLVADARHIGGRGRIARGDAAFGIVWIAGDGVSVSRDRVLGGVAATPADGVAPILLSRGTTEQESPSIASDGAGYLVAWIEEMRDRAQLMAVALNRNGTPVDAPAMLVEQLGGYPWSPRAVFGHGMYLVAWLEDEKLHAMRLDAAGRPIDSLAFGNVPARVHFDVTPTPGGFFAVWESYDGMYGAAIPASGPAEAPKKLLDAGDDPHVAFNGSTFLVTYLVMGSPRMIRLGETAPHALDQPAVAAAAIGNDFAVLEPNRLLRIEANTLATAGRIDFASALPPAIAGNTLITADGTRIVAQEITPQWTPRPAARTAATAPGIAATSFAQNAAGDLLAAYARHVAELPYQGALRLAVQPVGEVQTLRRRLAQP